MTNTTRLRRRIDKYLDDQPRVGRGMQSGETRLSREATGDVNAIKRMRAGSNVGEPILNRIDAYLAQRGY